MLERASLELCVHVDRSADLLDLTSVRTGDAAGVRTELSNCELAPAPHMGKAREPYLKIGIQL